MVERNSYGQECLVLTEHSYSNKKTDITRKFLAEVLDYVTLPFDPLPSLEEEKDNAFGQLLNDGGKKSSLTRVMKSKKAKVDKIFAEVSSILPPFLENIVDDDCSEVKDNEADGEDDDQHLTEMSLQLEALLATNDEDEISLRDAIESDERISEAPPTDSQEEIQVTSNGTTSPQESPLPTNTHDDFSMPTLGDILRGTPQMSPTSVSCEISQAPLSPPQDDFRSLMMKTKQNSQKFVKKQEARRARFNKTTYETMLSVRDVILLTRSSDAFIRSIATPIDFEVDSLKEPCKKPENIKETSVGKNQRKRRRRPSVSSSVTSISTTPKNKLLKVDKSIRHRLEEIGDTIKEELAEENSRLDDLQEYIKLRKALHEKEVVLGLKRTPFRIPRLKNVTKRGIHSNSHSSLSSSCATPTSLQSSPATPPTPSYISSVPTPSSDMSFPESYSIPSINSCISSTSTCNSSMSQASSVRTKVSVKSLLAEFRGSKEDIFHYSNYADFLQNRYHRGSPFHSTSTISDHLYSLPTP